LLHGLNIALTDLNQQLAIARN